MPDARPRHRQKPWKLKVAVVVAAASLGAVGIAVAAPRPPAPPPATPNPGCTLKVPDDPLSARGLATPYRLGATDPRSGACHEPVDAQGAFVQATILDPATGRLSVYHPLVVDEGRKPAAPPVVPACPGGAVVGLWFGFNGDTLTLGGSPAACARASASTAWAVAVRAGRLLRRSGLLRRGQQGRAQRKLQIPALGTANDGKPCLTARDFALVDQDQSDNVTTDLPGDCRTAGRPRPPTANASALGAAARRSPTAATTGCSTRSWTRRWAARRSPHPTSPTVAGPRRLSRLNELQAAAAQQAPVALVPQGDPMTLVDGKPSVAKANLYRAGVDQPPLDRRAGSTRSYCRNLRTAGLDRLTADRRLLRTAPSPDDGVGLLKFLTDRLQGSLQQLGCTHPAASAHPEAAAEPDPADQAAASAAVRTLDTLKNG